MINFKKLINSFRHAFGGLAAAMQTEQNFRIMAALSILVFIAALWLVDEVWRWSVLILASAFWLTVELINTAVEKAMDVVLPASLKEIKWIKNVMAAAALLASLGWLGAAAFVLFVG